ncbi:MAG: hypothetical protein EDQ89_06945 [Acidobacteria bacterium]|nr:MAG: hypothetical protein EDQ89_06945 [Acidobacteriota bacterium]MCL4287155.1 hypothetical protein [Thermoleophilia bacterium]GIK77589.1 MAG: hypothetical protein BroJett022_12790 [Actinomycetes bacterium]
MRPQSDPGAEPDVLVLTTLGAPRAATRLRRGRVRPLAGPPEATPLPLTRVTLIRPRPFDDDAAAAAWLRRVGTDRELRSSLAREAAVQVNRLLHAHRTAAGDPCVADIDPARAAAVRFGYGSGDEVADGRWHAAFELADADRAKLFRRDYEALRPQERVAAVLGGRESVAPHEELIVRARGDFDAGRMATAALGLGAAFRALRASGGADAGAAGAAAGAEDAVLAGRHPDEEALATALRAAETEIRRRARD